MLLKCAVVVCILVYKVLFISISLSSRVKGCTSLLLEHCMRCIKLEYSHVSYKTVNLQAYFLTTFS